MTTTLVPIFVCVVLPIAIVLITALTRINSDNKRSKIIMKAIEANNEVDTDRLIKTLQRPEKTPGEILNLRLLRGCIFTLIGMALAIIGIVNFATGADFDSDSVTVTLVFGGVSLALGISYLIVYFVTRRQIDSPENK